MLMLPNPDPIPTIPVILTGYQSSMEVPNILYLMLKSTSKVVEGAHYIWDLQAEFLQEKYFCSLFPTTLYMRQICIPIIPFLPICHSCCTVYGTTSLKGYYFC